MRYLENKKVVVAMSPHKSLRDYAGQAGGFKKKKKVLVAMSGGIDSSVAAALLKKANFGVVGVFMRFWQDPTSKRRNKCCSPEAEKRARAVAATIKIPFYVLNFEKEFKKKVVNYFLKEYKAGLTPNPCIICNKKIKFGLLLEKALSLGADFVATGHYVRRQEAKNPALETSFRYGAGKEQGVKYKLFIAKDKKKDQSYFLWQLSQKQLKKILFPLGDLTKKEVISLAKKIHLPVLKVPESQEICFILTTVNDFLKKHLKKIKPGKIINPQGKILGRHPGLPFYTIGQRKGIKLSGGPYYVLGKDLKKNYLIVTKNEKDLLKKELITENINWLSGQEPKLPLNIKAKIRYRQKLIPVIITKNLRAKIYNLKFIRSQRAITPGQSIVFYRGEEMLGGGVIKN